MRAPLTAHWKTAPHVGRDACPEVRAGPGRLAGVAKHLSADTCSVVGLAGVEDWPADFGAPLVLVPGFAGADDVVLANRPFDGEGVIGAHETNDENRWRTEIGWPIFHTAQPDN